MIKTNTVYVPVLVSVCVLNSTSRFQDVLELFNCYYKLAEILREKSGKGRTPSSKSPRSLLSVGFVSTLLTALFRYIAVAFIVDCGGSILTDKHRLYSFVQRQYSESWRELVSAALQWRVSSLQCKCSPAEGTTAGRGRLHRWTGWPELWQDIPLSLWNH